MKNATVEDDIRQAMEDIKAEETETVEEAVEVTEEEPKDEENTETVEVAEPVEVAPVEEVEPAPVALSAAAKEKWKELPKEIREEWAKRENDMHRAMTAQDGDLAVGRKIKEIARPYEAIIRAEGGTVEGAFRDLLNTSYILRTGSPQQKAQVLLQAAQQFGVDLGGYIGQQQHNPLAHVQRELEMIRQQANPEIIKKQLQEDMERDNITREIEAFAANPSNKHFETVRPAMAALMTSGKAKNLQDAYDQAIWSDPSIRAELLKAQAEQESKKKAEEMAAKKKAAASVTGSLGTASPKARAPQNNSIEDDIRAAWQAQLGSSKV